MKYIIWMFIYHWAFQRQGSPDRFKIAASKSFYNKSFKSQFKELYGIDLKNLIETVDILIHVLYEEELQKLKSIPEDNLLGLNFGLRQWTRKKLGMGSDSYELIKNVKQ